MRHVCMSVCVRLGHLTTSRSCYNNVCPLVGAEESTVDFDKCLSMSKIKLNKF